jgi:hypothetical protein
MSLVDCRLSLVGGPAGHRPGPGAEARWEPGRRRTAPRSGQDWRSPGRRCRVGGRRPKASRHTPCARHAVTRGGPRRPKEGPVGATVAKRRGRPSPPRAMLPVASGWVPGPGPPTLARPAGALLRGPGRWYGRRCNENFQQTYILARITTK